MSHRIEKLRQRIQQKGLDAFLVSSLTNIRYLFGFTGSNAIALITSDLSFFISDRRYTQQAKEEVHNADIIIAQKDLLSELERLPLENCARMGVEAVHLSLKQFLDLKKVLPGTKIVGSEKIVENIASVKADDEIENIRRAAGIIMTVFEQVLSVIKPGVLELDISAEISYVAMRNGSEGDPFEPIVASGKRSALPHGISSDKPVERGDLVILDFGARVNGYAADFTRTVLVGDGAAKQREMAQAVVKALAVAESSVIPGMSARELDRIARDSLMEDGYGEYFQHSLGHGLGLDVHEMPAIGERSKDTLVPGNVIALEPGVYIPGLGGVRVEDDFVVTEEGVENLTPYPRDLCVCDNC